MNSPESPLSPQTLDELLSADIDGELERAAAELGLTLDDAVAAMNTAPGPARRVELTRARDALAAPIPLDKSTEVHLVSAALTRAVGDLRTARNRPRRAWRVLVAAGSAAAVIAGVVALAATHPGSEDSKSSTALSRPNAANAARSEVTPGALPAPVPAETSRSVEFGDISHPAALRAQLASRLALTAAAPAPNSYSPLLNGPTGPSGPFGATGAQGANSVARIVDGQDAAGLAGPQGAQGDEGVIGVLGAIGPIGPSGVIRADGLALAGPQGVTGSAAAPVAATPARRAVAHTPESRAAYSTSSVPDRERACTATIERNADLSSVPVLSGTGTYTGRPVVVAVFPRAQTYVAYVMATPSCGVVLQETLP